MYVGFAFFLDLILVCFMHWCLFLLYKSFTSPRASNGGLGWRFAKLAKVYVREKWNFLTI
jgi:hypothetical protein